MIINDKSLFEFEKDFYHAVEELQKKYNVTISLGPITYEKDRFSTKMSVKNGQDPEEVARADFDADVWKFAHLGLGPGMYKRIFMGKNNERYALVGFNTRAQKYPLKVIRISDGAYLRAGENLIREFLNEYYVENQNLAD